MSSFYQLKLKNIQFIDCKLIEVDFTESDLTEVSFDSCDLDRAIFFDSILEKADFRTVSRLIMDPERNRIKKAKFSKENIAGLLTKYDIIIE